MRVVMSTRTPVYANALALALGSTEPGLATAGEGIDLGHWRDAC